MKKKETLTVEFLRTTWKAEADDDDLCWGIYKVTDNSGKEITIKGKIDPAICQLDMCFDVVGRWETDPKYGKQFSFYAYSRRQPNGEWGTKAFLQQANGIGCTYADQIYHAFGEQSINTLISDPVKVSLKTHIKLATLQTAAEKLGPLLGEAKNKLPLITLFKGTKISEKTAERVVKAKINDAVNRISKNPFMLMQFPGIAFKQCDSLRIKLKLSINMYERVVAACEQTFADSSDQTWLTSDDVKKGMQKLLELESPITQGCINVLINNGNVVKNDVGDEKWYALTTRYENEKYVAEQLYERMNLSGEKWPIEEIFRDQYPTDHQKEVVIHNMKVGGRIAVLPGSPGTGKTFVLARILEAFMMKNKGYTHACAPTGKAAQRLTENLNGQQATTIHRMLEPVPLGDGKFGFKLQGAINGNYVDADLVAVDETSMVNNDLAAAFFRGIHPSTYIIFVGDQNQLPPVGPGTMFRDLQTLGFSGLTEIKRNSGLIVDTCAKLRDGKKANFKPIPVDKVGKDVTPDANVQLIACSKDEQKAKHVEVLVKRMMSGDMDIVNRGNILETVQFVTATHKNPYVGRNAMNEMLQGLLNPNGRGEHDHYKVGDKIICTDNCQIEDATGPKTFVANGELGYVVESHKKWIAVCMNSDISRTLRVPCGPNIGNGWDLGYCITVHKSQGSEWEFVITVIGTDYGTKMVTCREWFFTDVSRAKHCKIIIGSQGLITLMCNKVRAWDRKSLIVERMKGFEQEIQTPRVPVDASH